MADVHVVSSIQATVALGQKLASLLQTLIELNPSSQGELKDLHYDVETTSGTLRQLEDLMSLDETIRFERNTKPAVTSLYLDEIETLAVRCGLIYKSIILITQKAGVRGNSKEGNDEASSIENLKNELLTGPIPDPGSIKSIKLIRVPAKYEQREWLEPRFERCQEQLQWMRTGLLVHLHIFRLAQLQNGSVERNTGDFENELMYRSSIQLLRRRQVKFTKKKAKKQEKSQRQWELWREDESSETASIASDASSVYSSTTASTAVDDEASVKGETTAVKDPEEPTDTDKSGSTEANTPDAKGVNDANQGETQQLSVDKGKTLPTFSFGGGFGANLPAYFFDWKQRLFGTDDKFKTDWPSTKIEAYLRNHQDFGKPRKVPFGHKRLQYGLNKVIKDGQKEKSNWNRYVELGHFDRLIVDEIVEEANRDQSRQRVMVAFQECNKDAPPNDSFILVFFSIRKEPKPISFKDAVGRTFTLPFETCRKWESMKGNIMEAFNHVPEVGPHVIEGHFDLLNSKGETILQHLWNTTIKPGASITMRMWPATTPLRGFYAAPPFIANPHAPNSGSQAMHFARMQYMQQMQQRRMAAMRAAQPPGFMGGAPPPPPGGGRPVFVDIVDGGRPPRSEYEISEKEDEQLMFVNFVEELEKANSATVSDLLRKFTTLRDVTDDDSLCDVLAVDSDYDSDDSTSTSSSSEIIND